MPNTICEGLESLREEFKSDAEEAEQRVSFNYDFLFLKMVKEMGWTFEQFRQMQWGEIELWWAFYLANNDVDEYYRLKHKKKMREERKKQEYKDKMKK